MSNRKEILSAYAGWREYMEVDSDDPRKMVIHTEEQCEPIVETAKALSDLRPGDFMRHAAIIPKHVLDRSYREGWFNDKEKWKQWANDPDNRKFRVWAGQL